MLFDIYCDESRQDLIVNKKSITETNRYCCIGGLMLPTAQREKVKQQLYSLQNKYDVHGELKWGTVSTNKMQFYLSLIDLFFEVNEFAFRAVVIDSTVVDNTSFNGNDHELGYYKFYYQLLVHWLESGNTYRVFTDQKTNHENNRLHELQRIVNCGAPSNTIVSELQAIDSRESIILQLENVIMGAVGYKFNSGASGTSSAKQAIVNRIEMHLKHCIMPTSLSEQKFNVFAIELKGGL